MSSIVTTTDYNRIETSIVTESFQQTIIFSINYQYYCSKNHNIKFIDTCLSKISVYVLSMRIFQKHYETKRVVSGYSIGALATVYTAMHSLQRSFVRITTWRLDRTTILLSYSFVLLRNMFGTNSLNFNYKRSKSSFFLRKHIFSL